ncbi:hypothetical protein [Chloroflexus sp.]|uniref:hypothetical protein n=1 Tax=Chloroflexus sp. TaxID=1904827 RepID=UPI002ADD6FBD|nr:hypothetical protein [Chloroflexus sp.]
MTLEAFDRLFDEFVVAHAQRLANLTVTKRKGTLRQRAVGAGGKHRYSLRDRLPMTLFWLRVYTTYEVMGLFYGLDKTNIEDHLKGILTTLDTMTTFTYDRPGPERKQLRSAGAVMDAFSDVHLVIDVKEQRIERPKAGKDEQGKPQDRQKPYTSGKKKAHTLKNQSAYVRMG